MTIAYFKLFCVTSLAIVVIGCSNRNPVSTSTDDRSTVAVTSQTYMAAVPATTQGTSCAMVYSQYYSGNLEMVRRGPSLTLEHLYWCPGAGSWVSTGTFGSNTTYDPAMCVQLGDVDHKLHVVVHDASTSGLQHYWRYGSGAGSWVYTGQFSSGCVGSPAIISNLEYVGNLEVVVRTNNYRLKHLYRGPNLVWVEEATFGSERTVVGDPKLVQTGDGNFHVIAAILFNGKKYMGYWKRSIINGSYTWQYKGSFGTGNSYLESGYALMVNIPNNTIEACFLENWGTARYTFYKCTNESNFYFDGTLNKTNAVYLGATPDNNNSGKVNYEFHIAFQIAGGGVPGEHWKITW